MTVHLKIRDVFDGFIWKQECIPVGCVPLARNRTRGGRGQRPSLGQRPPGRDHPPWTETPLDRDPLDRGPPL